MTLTWTEDHDDNDNSIYEADSPWTDDGASAGFYFRLKQRLRDNRIEWYDASDSECTLGGETFLTLDEAKAACQAAADQIIASEVGEEPEDSDGAWPVGWMVYCAPSEELDYRFFGEQQEAEVYASENDQDAIYPMFCGEPVAAAWTKGAVE